MNDLTPEKNTLFEMRNKVHFSYSVSIPEERRIDFEEMMRKHGYKFIEKGTFKQSFVKVNIDSIVRSEK